jgi:GAF domain-containing protein
LLAHRPALKPILSDTLTHRAWEEGLAFSWQQVGKEESVRRLSMNAGIYVPMMALDEEVGMLCIENTAEGASFSSEQLAVMVLIARAMVLPLLYRIQRESA